VSQHVHGHRKPPSILPCLKRFAELRRGAIERLLLRIGLATTDRRRIDPRHPMRPSRLDRIARISPSKILQSLICEANTVVVELRVVNK
jgi:hypothetical protein